MPERKKRKYSRFLISVPLKLSEPGGRLLDGKAMAHDLTPEGFGFETTAELKNGERLHFFIQLPQGPIAGEARVAWLRQDREVSWAGAKIVKLPWVHARRIKKLVTPPGYDWAGLLDRGVLAGFLIVSALVVEDVIRFHPHVTRTVWDFAPKGLALSAMGVSLAYFLGLWGR